MTVGPEVRFRTQTLTRYKALPEEERAPMLEELYRDNLARLMAGLAYCVSNDIRLYRLSAGLFPLADLDDGVGMAVLDRLTPELAQVGEVATREGLRLLIHPEQYVVLNSARPEVQAVSVAVAEFHARCLDRMGLPSSAWNPMILHGGAKDRTEELTLAVRALPEVVRRRLVLENDEVSVGAADILRVCLETGTPMVFDAHHHVVREKLSGLQDPEVAAYTHAARATWPDPGWQLVHLSNGREGHHDRRHSDLISEFPEAYLEVPWIEIEAKGKEQAIAGLRAQLSQGFKGILDQPQVIGPPSDKPRRKPKKKIQAVTEALEEGAEATEAAPEPAKRRRKAKVESVAEVLAEVAAEVPVVEVVETKPSCKSKKLALDAEVASPPARSRRKRPADPPEVLEPIS